MLTVAREMAHQIATDVAHSAENPRLEPATEQSVQNASIAAALERAVIAGQESVRRCIDKRAGAKKDGEGQELPSPHYSANELAN